MDVSPFLLHKSSPAFSFIQTSVLSSHSPNDSFLSASPLNHLFSHLLHLKRQHINSILIQFDAHLVFMNESLCTVVITSSRLHNSISAALPVSLPILLCSSYLSLPLPSVSTNYLCSWLSSVKRDFTFNSYFACPCLSLTWPSISYQVSIPFISFSLL